LLLRRLLHHPCSSGAKAGPLTAAAVGRSSPCPGRQRRARLCRRCSGSSSGVERIRFRKVPRKRPPAPDASATRGRRLVASCRHRGRSSSSPARSEGRQLVALPSPTLHPLFATVAVALATAVTGIRRSSCAAAGLAAATNGTPLPLLLLFRRRNKGSGHRLRTHRSGAARRCGLGSKRRPRGRGRSRARAPAAPARRAPGRRLRDERQRRNRYGRFFIQSEDTPHQ
jgi:hypothetical protein